MANRIRGGWPIVRRLVLDTGRFGLFPKDRSGASVAVVGAALHEVGRPISGWCDPGRGRKKPWGSQDHAPDWIGLDFDRASAVAPYRLGHLLNRICAILLAKSLPSQSNGHRRPMKERTTTNDPAAVSGVQLEEERCPDLKAYRRAAASRLPKVDFIDVLARRQEFEPLPVGDPHPVLHRYLNRVSEYAGST